MESKTKHRMLGVAMLAGCMLVASQALGAATSTDSSSATSTDSSSSVPKQWTFTDNTTLDQGTSTATQGQQPVSCSDDPWGVLAVEIKCGSSGSWSTLTSSNNSLTCGASDLNALVRDKGDHDNVITVPWDCDYAGTDDPPPPVWQEVTVEGELSSCREVNAIRATSQCGQGSN